MKEKDMDNDKLEQLLRKAHPSEPSPLLKERITAEAKKAWNQASVEVSWQIPIMRLAASAAAAIIIVSITNFASNHSLKRWHPGDVEIIKVEVPDLEELPEMPYSLLMRNLVSVNRRPSMPDASALCNYTERVRHILIETQQNSTSIEQVPDGGRSRLFKVQTDSSYYS